MVVYCKQITRTDRAKRMMDHTELVDDRLDQKELEKAAREENMARLEWEAHYEEQIKAAFEDAKNESGICYEEDPDSYYDDFVDDLWETEKEMYMSRRQSAYRKF